MDKIHRATLADAPAIADICNWYIENTVITFEVDPVSDAEMALRIESALAKDEWLVHARGDEILDYTTLIGEIALPNEASVHLHESLGFEKVGHLRRVGWKHERWIDVGSWQIEKPPTP